MKNKIYIFLSLFFLFVYISPYFNLVNDYKILIGDNLNQHVAVNKILAQNGSLFVDAEEEVPFIMGGIKRGFLKTELNFGVLLYKFFSVELAYSINRIIMHLIAFVGFILFLKRYIFNEHNNLIPLIALGFATLPFFSNGFLTIAGQPLLLYCYLNIFNNKDNFKDWLIIALFPFFSSLVLGNIFFHFYLIFYLIIFRNRIIFCYKIILSFLVFGLTTLIFEYRLFELFFFLDFESFRTEMLRLGTLNFKGFLGTSLCFLINGHRHFASLHYPIILILVFYTFSKSIDFKKNSHFFFLLVVLIFSVLFENFYYGWSFLNTIKSNSNFLNSFTFRFYSIFPLTWYLLYSFSIKKLKWNIKFSYLICFLVVVNNFFGTSKISSENSFYHTFFNKKSSTHYSIKNYYSEKFITSIKSDLNFINKTKVACVGFPSVILNYNNINTIGGFLNNYPLEKKHTMKLIMKNEFKRSKKLFENFNNYGVYCEIQSSELIFNNDLKCINNLNVDIDLLKKQGCDYIFSKIPISKFNNLEIESICFENQDSNSYLKNMFVFEI